MSFPEAFLHSEFNRERARQLGRAIKTHGQSKPVMTRAYRSWRGMKYRCDRVTGHDYPSYGGRGITYDPAWVRFEAFYADMGDCPEGMSIDRIDNDGPYTKANCRWADPLTQRLNQRPRRPQKPRKDKGIPRGPYGPRQRRAV